MCSTLRELDRDSVSSGQSCTYRRRTLGIDAWIIFVPPKPTVVLKQ